MRELAASLALRAPVGLQLRDAMRARAVAFMAAWAVMAVALGGLAGLHPKFALAGVLGALLAALVLYSLPVGVCVFVIIAHLEALPRLGGAVSLAKVAGLLLVGSWIVAAVIRPRVRSNLGPNWPLEAGLLVSFIAWLMATLLWADNVAAGLDTIPRYALSLALFPIVAAAIRERAHALSFIAVMIAGAVISAAYGLLFRDPAEDRLGGAGMNANMLGSVLIFGTVLSLVLAFNRSLNSVTRTVAGLAGAFCAYSLLVTVSRGALLGAGAALIAAVIFGGRGRRAPLATLGAVAAGCVVLYFIAFAPAQARERISAPGDGSGRIYIWEVGWRMVEAHPLTGIGIGNFSTSTVDYLLQPGSIPRSAIIVDDQKVAHNVYLQVLSETGAVGLALFFGILAFAIASGVLAARAFERGGDPGMGMISRGVVISIAGVLTASFFSGSLFVKPLWLTLALCPALLVLARHEARLQLGEPPGEVSAER